MWVDGSLHAPTALPPWITCRTVNFIDFQVLVSQIFNKIPKIFTEVPHVLRMYGYRLL